MNKSSLMKTLSIMLSVTALLFVMGTTVYAQTTTIKEGDLIRGPDGIKVYIVNAYGFKRHIFNPAVFNMYAHFNWNNIHAVSQATLDSYKTSDLYRADGDTKVYGMEEVSEAAGLANKRWINMTAEEFIAKGYSWDQIFTINATEGAFYGTGSDITYSTSTTTTTSTGALNVSLASDTPASKVIAGGAAYSDVLKVTLSAGSQAASVTGVTVSKYGLIANSNVTGVSVWDAMGVRHGNILTSLTSDDKVNISFTGTPINVPANSSTYFIVKVTVSSSATTGTMYFGIASASDISAGGSVGGTFPVNGNVMSLTSGSSSLGAYTIAAQTLSGAAASSSTTGNTDIGTTQLEVGKFQFANSNSNEDLLVKQIVVYVEGSLVETTDVKNWKLLDSGAVVLAEATQPSDRYVTFNLATPYKIAKGVTKNLSVKADIVDGSTRYFRTHIQNEYDVMVMGASTGFYITPTTFTDQVGTTAWFNIKSGSLTVNKSTTSPTGDLAPGQTGVVLGKFEIKATGEKMEIRKMDLAISSTAASLLLAGTVKVQNEAGTETYLSVAATDAALSAASIANRYDLSSYITLNSNETKVLVVVGDIKSTASSGAYTAEIGYFYAKRFSTNDYADFNTTAYTDANQLTVVDVSLSVAANTAYASRIIAPGTQSAKIGSFSIQASAAEDVRVSTIALTWTSSTATPSSDLTNLSLWDGTTQIGTTIGTPTGTTESFTTSWVIPKSSTKILDVKANTSSTAANVFVTNLAASSISGVGVNSGKSLGATPSAGKAGQTITMTAGSLTISKDSSSAGSKVLTAGLTGVELAKYNFAAANEDLTLNKITLSISTGQSENIGMIYLKDGSTTLGSTTLFADQATFTGLTVAIPADGTKVLGVYADVTGSGVMTPAATLSVLIPGKASTYMTVNKASGGTVAATSITITGTTAEGNTMLFHNSAPVIALASDSPSGTKSGAASQEVAKFTVYNQGTRDMRMASLSVTISAGGLAGLGQATSAELWDGSTKLAAAVTGGVTSASTTSTIEFDNDLDVNTALDNYVITAGTTKTFTVKMDTSAMRTGLTSGQNSNLTVSITGSTGTDTAVNSEEAYWQDGNFIYYYTPAGTSTPSGAYSASDSYPVSGNTLTY
jgi:hypothetical protein